MTIYEFLSGEHKQVPPWLTQFNAEMTFPREHFFASRVVYYPGSGLDGQPVKLFGSTHTAHCFVYVDYGVERSRVEAALNDDDEHELCHRQLTRFRGYHTLARVNLTERDLTPKGWQYHITPMRNPFTTVPAFGFLEVLERNQGLDDGHGARRLAILFLGADGIATYDALFCQRNSIKAPFAVVTQDHGFGGNYDRFGQGGMLQRVAQQCNVIPQWLLVADNTNPWEGFARVPGVSGELGGSGPHLRFLYKLLHRNLKGKFCRCCGQSIILGNLVIGCGRTSACPHCNKLICGPHSFNGGGGWPARRFCEICGSECSEFGNCAVHGLQQAQ